MDISWKQFHRLLGYPCYDFRNTNLHSNPAVFQSHLRLFVLAHDNQEHQALDPLGPPQDPLQGHLIVHQLETPPAL